MRILLIHVAALSLLASALPAQQAAPRKHERRWEVNGLPALNFDADEGFGYGAVIEVYNYGDGNVEPYAFTIQPNVFFTTGGRRDVSLFVDAPRVIPGGWRITGSLSREQQFSTPYYGRGNATTHDEALETAPNDYYYRFGQTKRVFSLDIQKKLPRIPLRVLAGSRISTVKLDPTPFDSGSTLLASQLAGSTEPLSGWWNAVRGGVVWDSRNREVGTTRGVWSDALVQRYDRALGSERSYTRWTVTDRRYFPVGGSVVYAQRLLLQGVNGDVPVHDLTSIQGSFKGQDGLGGSKSVRGLPRNRYQGKGLFLANAELRWRAADFRIRRGPAHLVFNAFVDGGRVWEEKVDLSSIVSDLHHGYGGGVRLGMGGSFVVAVDVGHSSQSTAPVYIGLGYLY